MGSVELGVQVAIDADSSLAGAMTVILMCIMPWMLYLICPMVLSLGVIFAVNQA